MNRYVITGMIKEEDEPAWAATQVREVLGIVQERHGVTLQDITGRKRAAKYTHARADIAERLASKGFQLKETGAVLGGRDHSTVIYLIRKGQRAREVWAT